MCRAITIKAYAKINPSLDVTRRRPDGYHEVRMLLQQITLYDVIRMEKTDAPGVSLEMTGAAADAVLPAGDVSAADTALPAGDVSAADTALPAGDDVSAAGPALRADDYALLPADASNLACRAAQLLIDGCDIAGGVHIKLEKHIPIAAGLAGGSTDAAAVFRGMNELYDLHLSIDDLCKLALPLGADIPFCIRGGGQLAEGIGEVLTPLPPMPPCQILLVKPPEGVSTGAVYRALDEIASPDHPDINAALKAYASSDLSALCAVMGNVLETVTLPMLPRLKAIRSSLLYAGSAGAMMSGSGPTMFGLFETLPAAQHAAAVLQAQYPDCTVILTEPVSP